MYEISLDEDVTLSIKDDNGQYAFTPYMLDCLNGNHRYVQFEIVKYPFIATAIDVEQRLNDKIEALATERENIIGKMARMEKQQLKLRNKVQKLHKAKKALKTLREFM